MQSKQLKKPASTGDDKPAAAAAMSEDHVRQMAQVFAQEFAAELAAKRDVGQWRNGSNGAGCPPPVGRAVTLKSAPDVMEFYRLTRWFHSGSTRRFAVGTGMGDGS